MTSRSFSFVGKAIVATLAQNVFIILACEERQELEAPCSDLFPLIPQSRCTKKDKQRREEGAG